MEDRYLAITCLLLALLSCTTIVQCKLSSSGAYRGKRTVTAGQDIIHSTLDPKDSDTLHFRVRSDDVLVFDYDIHSGGVCTNNAKSPKFKTELKRICTPPLHWHMDQTETFEVLQGVMGYIFNGTLKQLTAGQSVTIVPYTLHTFWNAGDIDLKTRITVKPAGRCEAIFENLMGYSRDGASYLDMAYTVVTSNVCMKMTEPIPCKITKDSITAAASLLNVSPYHSEYTTNMSRAYKGIEKQNHHN
jgi:mannose-6-phosphate isomerase-like protein (cupin superfamily)